MMGPVDRWTGSVYVVLGEGAYMYDGREMVTISCVLVATKKYWPDGCQSVDASCKNSGDLEHDINIL